MKTKGRNHKKYANLNSVEKLRLVAEECSRYNLITENEILVMIINELENKNGRREDTDNGTGNL